MTSLISSPPPACTLLMLSFTLRCRSHQESELCGFLAAVCAVRGVRWHPAVLCRLCAEGEGNEMVERDCVLSLSCI